MGSIEQEKEYLYWLCRSLPAFAVTIRRIQETYGSFQQAYYIEGMELLRRGIIKNRKTAEIFEQAKRCLDAAPGAPGRDRTCWSSPYRAWPGLTAIRISPPRPWDYRWRTSLPGSIWPRESWPL